MESLAWLRGFSMGAKWPYFAQKCATSFTSGIDMIETNQANLVYASIPGAVYEAVWDAECQLLCPLRRSTLLVGTYEAEMNVKPVGLSGPLQWY